MKKLLLIIGLFACVHVNAQRKSRWENIGTYITKDSITKRHGFLFFGKKYTLIFVNKDETFAKEGDAVKQRLVDAYFKVYPAEAKTYNKKTAKQVIFIIDPDYKGVAATSSNVVRFNPPWMLKKPLDVDVVTHEVMHIVQGYGYGSGPVWLTEGIADYVRAVYGVDNEGAKWYLPKFNAKQSYTNSYRVTAKFFLWVEKNVKKNLVVNLDDRLRKHTYTIDSWKELTGKTLDELWADYAAANTPKEG